MKKRKKRVLTKKNKSQKDRVAFFIVLMLLFSSFFFPLFNYSFLSKSWSSQSMTVMALTLSLVTGKLLFSSLYEILLIAIILLHGCMLVLYSVSALKKNHQWYAILASCLGILLFLCGLFARYELQTHISLPIFGSDLGHISIGFGLYSIVVCSLVYLCFHKKLNTIIDSFFTK